MKKHNKIKEIAKIIRTYDIKPNCGVYLMPKQAREISKLVVNKLQKLLDKTGE